MKVLQQLTQHLFQVMYKAEVLLLRPNRVLMCPTVPCIRVKKMMGCLKRIIESQIITASI